MIAMKTMASSTDWAASCPSAPPRGSRGERLARAAAGPGRGAAGPAGLPRRAGPATAIPARVKGEANV